MTLEATPASVIFSISIDLPAFMAGFFCNPRDLHTKVGSVKDDYVSQESLDRQLKGLERQLSEIRADGRRRGEATTDQLTAMNGRMDKLFENLGK